MNATSLYFTPKNWFHPAIPATPTTQKGQDTRERILSAAREVFARDGYVEARMVDIAQAAGLSTGGLYRYFVDKTDVFAALIGDLHEELYQASGHTEHSFQSDPLAALTDANRGYVEHYFENRDVMRVFSEAAGVDERFRKIWWDMRNRHVNRFAKAFENTYGVNEVAGVSVEVATEAMTRFTTAVPKRTRSVWLAVAASETKASRPSCPSATQTESTPDSSAALAWVTRVGTGAPPGNQIPVRVFMFQGTL